MEQKRDPGPLVQSSRYELEAFRGSARQLQEASLASISQLAAGTALVTPAPGAAFAAASVVRAAANAARAAARIARAFAEATSSEAVASLLAHQLSDLAETAASLAKGDQTGVKGAPSSPDQAQQTSLLPDSSAFTAELPIPPSFSAATSTRAIAVATLCLGLAQGASGLPRAAANPAGALSASAAITGATAASAAASQSGLSAAYAQATAAGIYAVVTITMAALSDLTPVPQDSQLHLAGERSYDKTGMKKHKQKK